jgi:hypothetical protein
MMTKLQTLDELFTEEEKLRLEASREQIAKEDADPVIQAAIEAKTLLNESLPEILLEEIGESFDEDEDEE